MKISDYIIEVLKEKGEVFVPRFGVFSLVRSAAVVNQEDNSILPPAYQITFSFDKTLEKDSILDFYMRNKHIPREQALFELNTQVEYWNKKLDAGESFLLEPLGEFVISDSIVRFLGKRIKTDNPDFFGLEEINLSEIKSKNHFQRNNPKVKEGSTQWILWLFLIIFPLTGIAYVAATKWNVLVGEKSIDTFSTKTSTHRITSDEKITKEVPKQDSVLVKDSLAKDPANIEIQESLSNPK